jgi:hypothetical protein
MTVEKSIKGVPVNFLQLKFQQNFSWVYSKARQENFSATRKV